MSKKPPPPSPHGFRDQFLAEVAKAFETRRKALRHRGDLEVRASDAGDDAEWLEISLARWGSEAVILQLHEGNVGHFFVRSLRRADRGKVLMRLEHMRLVRNGTRIVAVYEDCLLPAAEAFSDDGSTTELIPRLWAAVTVRSEPGRTDR